MTRSMMAPISEPKKPAGSPAWYKPSAWPPYVASKEPAIPINAVITNPAGSRPGVNTLASNPTMKPINIVQIMLIAATSIGFRRCQLYAKPSELVCSRALFVRWDNSHAGLKSDEATVKPDVGKPGKPGDESLRAPRLFAAAQS